MAKQGLFSRLIIGDENLPDFNPSQLPKTRWGLWWDTFKNRLGALCKVNLLLLLFLIPVIAVLLFSRVIVLPLPIRTPLKVYAFCASLEVSRVMFFSKLK